MTTDASASKHKEIWTRITPAVGGLFFLVIIQGLRENNRKFATKSPPNKLSAATSNYHLSFKQKNSEPLILFKNFWPNESNLKFPVEPSEAPEKKHIY